jgi:hypothetical protein
MLRRAFTSSWFKTQTDTLSDFRLGSVSAGHHSESPQWADRSGSIVWQTLPACPDQQTSTNLPDQSGSGE